MTPTVTEEQIFTALRAFLILIVPGVPVVRGQPNRVASPGADNYIVMTPIMRDRLATNVDTYDTDAGTVTRTKSTEITVQLDIHGPDGGDNSEVISILWRSEFATTTIDGTVFTPLFGTDGHQMPFINGENQYEDRWVKTLHLQASPAVSTPQQFADSVTVIFEKAD